MWPEKHIRKSISFTILFIISTFLFSSCGEDDIVKPGGGNVNGVIIDTIDAYTWTMDTIYGYYVDRMYVADTSNIFLAGGYYMIHTDGKINKVIDYGNPGFACYCIAGYSKNEVYFGGGNPLRDSSNSVLMIWNGSGFRYIEIPEDTSFQIVSMLVNASNDVWLVTGRNSVYKYLNGNLIKYKVDSLISYGKLFLSPSGELYLFTCHISVNGHYVINFSYKFENDKFHLISFDSTNANTEMGNGTYNCGLDVIRLGRKNLFFYDAREWILLTSTGFFQPYNIGGKSKNELVCYGMRPGYPSVFLWDGKKLSMEKNFDLTHNFPQLPTSNEGVVILDNKIYMNFSNFRYQISSLVIGRPKRVVERR